MANKIKKANAGIKIVNGMTHITTATALYDYIIKSNEAFRVPEDKDDPEERAHPWNPDATATNISVEFKVGLLAGLLRHLGSSHPIFQPDLIVKRDLTYTGILEGDYVFTRHHPQYGYGKASVNYGLPKGMSVSKLKPGIKIKTRWNEGDCYAVILDRDTVKKGRTFELHVLLESGNVTHVQSDQVLEIIGSVF